jgi:GT2 family glycosyltransferase
MVDVSIIILNYNTFQLTCDCIESIYEKTQGLTYEIILVDNASTECSAEAFKIRFPKILLLQSPVNLGFAKGVNYGLKASKGNAVLLLNSDTVLLNNAVYYAYQRLSAEAEIAVVSGKSVTLDGEIQHVAQRFPSIKLILAEVLRLYRFMNASTRATTFLGGYFNHDREVYADWTWATFFLARRSAVERLPGQQFDETFFMYEEDKLWCHHFAKLGYKILYTPQPEIQHHVSGSSKDPQGESLRNRRILQNEFLCLSLMKNKPYAVAYFLLKSLQYRLSGYKKAKEVALLYQRVALGQAL